MTQTIAEFFGGGDIHKRLNETVYLLIGMQERYCSWQFQKEHGDFLPGYVEKQYKKNSRTAGKISKIKSDFERAGIRIWIAREPDVIRDDTRHRAGRLHKIGLNEGDEQILFNKWEVLRISEEAVSALANGEIKRVILSGFPTDIYIKNIALGALKNQFKVCVLEDCTGVVPRWLPDHQLARRVVGDRKQLTLARLQDNGVLVTSSRKVEDFISRRGIPLPSLN